MENPYRPETLQPQIVDAHIVPATGMLPRPAVVGWFLIYCVAISVLYILVAAAGGALAYYAEQLSESEQETTELRIQGVVYLSLGIALAVVHLIAPLLPRKKWSWLYGFAPIVIGLTSPCCLPMTLPLLLWWIKPETKQWFEV